MTMKRIAYLLAGIVLAACQSSNEFILEGTLPQPFTGTVYLTYIPAGEALTRIDSVTLNEETDFRFRHAIEHPDAYRVITSPRRYDAAFIAEPQGNYRIDFSSEDYPVPVQVLKGGAEQTLMNDYLSSLKDSRRQEQELNAAYAEKLAKGDDASKAQADSLMQLLSDVFQAREQTTKDFILQHPKSFAACQLAGDLLLYTYPELDEIHSQMDTLAYAYSRSYREFKQKYDEAKSKWIQDRPAPDFTTHDLNGRTVSLSDFRGQYVLLDFWASWCKPCRKRAAELKAIYPELQARGITVCGLSMDEKREQWAAATHEDGIVWTNTGEVKPFKDNAIAAAYHVSQLPTMFLIGPEGTIVMQNPEIDDLLKLPLKK